MLLSFFDKGEGSQVGMTATVTFQTPNGPVSGGTITVREQDIVNNNKIFAHYKLVTTTSPIDTTGITIKMQFLPKEINR